MRQIFKSKKGEVFTKLAICVFLLFATLYLFSPGSYSNDSWGQYIHAKAHYYADWWDLGYTFLWHKLLNLTGGAYKSLYYLQMCLYWLFVLLLIWRVKIKSLAFWLIITVCVFCVFIPQYLMRDSLFVLLWGIAAMIFLNSYRIAKPFNKAIFILLSLVFFIYGLWTRSNTIIALIPIAYGFITYKRKTKKRLLLIFSSVSICVCTLLGMQTINYKVLHAHNHFPTYKLKLLDIVGISKLSKENLLPKDILFNPNKDYDTLLAEYTSATIDDIYWRSKRPIIHEPNDELNRSVLIAWINAIKKHPAFYIQNRTKGFLNYLKINKRVGANEYRNVHFGIEMPNPVNIVVKDIPAKTYFIKIYDYFNSSIFFSPWLWLLINCVGFVTFLKMYLKRAQPIWRANALIQLSGILLLLSQFPIYQIDLDFRYTYWNIFVFLIGISSLFQNNTATLKKN